MAKIGVSTALINTNISGKPLLHSIDVALERTNQKILIIDDELRSTLLFEVDQLLDKGIKVYFWGDLFRDVSSFPSDRPNNSCRNEILEGDPVVFIFTSGTTGTLLLIKIKILKIK